MHRDSAYAINDNAQPLKRTSSLPMLCIPTLRNAFAQEQLVMVVSPAVDDNAETPKFVGDGPGYAMQEAEMPLTESLQDTIKRILPVWHDSIAPAIKSGQRVLIVAHGNSIRVSSSRQLSLLESLCGWKRT